MQQTRLGQSGLKISQLGLGCMSYGEGARGAHQWALSEAGSRLLIRQALDMGNNLLDCANSYSHGTSEEIVGRALRDFVRGEDVVLAS